MRLSHKFKPNLNHKEQQIIQELSYHTSKLYNIGNYAIKNNEEVRPVYSRLDKQFKDNWHCNYLMAHNRQHCLKQLAKDWKSYFNNLKRYKANPDGLDGKPKPPGFKHMNSNPNDIIYTNEVARLKGNNLVLSLQAGVKDKYKVKKLKFELPTAIQSLANLDALQQVKIKQDNLSGDWYFLLIYKVQEKDKPQGNNVMSIDLGLDNLATIVFEQNTDSYIINDNVKINADVNGALNILRKFLNSIPKSIIRQQDKLQSCFLAWVWEKNFIHAPGLNTRARDFNPCDRMTGNGSVSHPRRISVA